MPSSLAVAHRQNGRTDTNHTSRLPEHPSPLASPSPAASIPPPPKPDAPLTKIGRWIIAGIHFAVLVGIIAFVTTQVVRSWSAPLHRAVVTVVAPGAREVTAPLDGVFQARRPLSKGSQVQAGEVLGWVASTSHQSSLHTLRTQVDILNRRKLLLATSRPSPSTQEEFRDVCERLVRIGEDLAALQVLDGERTITSPVTGQIATSLSGVRSIRRHQPVATVWGGKDEVLIEVKAPLSVIQRLIRQGQFTATFRSGQRAFTVTAESLPGTVMPVEGGIHARPGETWAVMHCRPDGLPGEVAIPGVMGRL
jgi:hypothetical protein